ncbi:MAG: ATP-grasp domain-containing protein [Gemmataceae bacterium]
MRVFVYEYLTAMGIGREPNSPEHGMYREGRAMRDAVVADFERIPGVEVFAFPDEAAPVEPLTFRGAVALSDWVLVIAPESEGILADLVKAIPDPTNRLLAPSLTAITLTSDKLSLTEHWRSHGVRTPATTDREPTPCEAFPLVWKPRDGAGSTATFRLNTAFDAVSAKAQLAAEPASGR